MKIAETPNGVVFGKANAKFFEAFAGKVRERIGVSLGPASRAPNGGGVSIPAQIQQLADLHAADVLTDQEFAAKKAELLARM